MAPRMSRLFGGAALAAAALVALARVAPAAALNNGAARTPPMGWMDWMYYTTEIDEALIKRTADEMASGGYRDAGYTVLSIDDGWSAPARDPVTNDLVADPVRFPSGIKALADYVHNLGLLLGIYADVGAETCGGYVGLNMTADLADKQYIKDMATFASWGIDSLKVDGCNEDPAIMNITYPALSRALNATGRSIWFSCSWPCYMGGCGGGPATLPPSLYLQLRDNCNPWRDFNDM